MRILFLNQYFPSDPAPTGVLFAELADRLATQGHASDFVSAREPYRATQSKEGRLRRELSALWRMLLAGIRSPRPEVIISGTSPPCLAFIATLVAFRHRARHFHWAMDLYPEIAVALGEVRPGMAARLIEALMGWCYRRANHVIVLDEDMQRQIAKRGAQAEIIRPWVFTPVLQSLDLALANEGAPAEAPWTWIYSGNLGRAHEWETLLEAQAVLERRDPKIRLLFQGGGPAWSAAQAKASALGLARCDWQPYVEEDQLPASLLRCKVCVVTQRPVAQGLLWPSKLSLLLALPRPILWVGPKESAIATTLRKLPASGIFAPGQSAEIADWLLALRENPSSPTQAKPVDPKAHRETALSEWLNLVLFKNSAPSG